MKRTKFSEAQKQQQPGRNLGEEALEVVVKNSPLKSDMIKALRLTCKSTKAAADATVKKFTISESQDSEAVERSGLLKNISILNINFKLMPSNQGASTHSQRLSRALSLLNLAVDVCSKSLEILEAGIYASPEIHHACGCVLGNSGWESLHELRVVHHSQWGSHSTPGFLSGMLAARPGTLPVLKTLICHDPSAIDIESLNSSGVVGNLTSLSTLWRADFYESNVAPAMVAAMRDLLQKAAKVENLHVESSTYAFFDCEQLVSLKDLCLKTPVLPQHLSNSVDYSPVLARPWAKLEILLLNIHGALLKRPALVRLFEAEDSLPALKQLCLENCSFTVDLLSCVRRPHLEALYVLRCYNGHSLLTNLTQLIQAGKCDVQSLQKFEFDCVNEDPLASAIEALSKFLSCPCAATLQELSISSAEIGAKGNNLLNDVVNGCPKLKHLDLSLNKLDRPAIALLLGMGNIWGCGRSLRNWAYCDNVLAIENLTACMASTHT